MNCSHVLHSQSRSNIFPHAEMESLDDGCLISPKARAVFLERIHQSLGIRHDDKVIKVLTKELKDLICHNTDLNGKKMYSSCSLLSIITTI